MLVYFEQSNIPKLEILGNKCFNTNGLSRIQGNIKSQLYALFILLYQLFSWKMAAYHYIAEFMDKFRPELRTSRVMNQIILFYK